MFFVQQRNDLDEFNQNILNFCFPQGIEVSKRHIPSYFYSFPLTNEKGERSFSYSLIIYEKVNDSGYYLPVILSLNSRIDDQDSFKEILGEILLILHYNNDNNKEINKKLDLLNFFLFNYSLIIPPNHCLMGINYKYLTVNIYFPSISEIPTTLNDSNMRFLFSILDIRIIINLFCCLLTERKIVLVSEKNNLLSNIFNALFRLMFPFKWMHTFIPVIYDDQIDVLEAPIPYVIGLVISKPNFLELNGRFKETVFVNIDTNDMYLPKKVNDIHLGNKDEKELKKVLQKIKNTDLVLNEERIKEENNSININLSFGTNIQVIFFNLIEKVIHNYYNYIEFCENEYYLFYGEKLKIDFKENKFMEDVLKNSDESTKETWEKIISANGFLEFINNNLTPQQLTNTFIFNHIIDNNHNKQIEGNNILNSYEFNLNINDIIEEVINTIFNESEKDMIELHNEFKTFYSSNTIINNKECVNISNKQTKLYLNIINKKNTNDINPLVFSLYCPISNHYKHLTKSKPITFKFYGDKGFIFFIKEMKSFSKWKQLLHYHLFQLSNELNSNASDSLYFEFLEKQMNITQHYEKFFKLILTAFYIREEININQNLIDNKKKKLQQLITLYDEAWILNNQEFPYYKYYKIVNELKSSQNTTINKQQEEEKESIGENIFKYEILPVKISTCQLEKLKRRQTTGYKKSPGFLEKLNQQFRKGKQEMNIKNKNNNSLENSENFSINSGTLSSKIRTIKTDLKNPIIFNHKIKPTLQPFVPNQIVDELFPLLYSINAKHKNNLCNAIYSISKWIFFL